MQEMYNLLFLSHGLFILSLTMFVYSNENVFILFILSELMLLSGILNFVIYGYFFQTTSGQAIALLMLALGAAGAAIGLVSIINYIKLQNSLSLAN